MTKTTLLQDWIGSAQSGSDDITPVPLRGLAATLERSDISTPAVALDVLSLTGEREPR